MKSSFSVITLNTQDLTAIDSRPYYNGSGIAFSGEVVPKNRYLSDYISAGSLTPLSSGGATASSISFTNTHTLDQFLFDPATVNGVDFTFGFPDTYDGGNVKTKLFYGAASGAGINSGIVWGISAISYVSGNTLNSSFGPETLVTGLANASGIVYRVISQPIVITGTVSGSDSLVLFKVLRKTADAGDLCPVNAILYGLQIQYKESSTEPSIW